MSSCNSNDFRDVPSVLNTAGPSPFAKTLDVLAGPLALAAAGLTFFMAYELTVAQPGGSLAGHPVMKHAVVEPKPNVGRPAVVHGPVTVQADTKTISMSAGAAPKRY